MPMRMIYGNTPVKTMNVRHFEINTNDCSVVPSDLQAGVTCFAKGQKMTGTGKAFEFATYGQLTTNASRYIPSDINIIEVSSTVYPIKLSVSLMEMYALDFSKGVTIGIVTIDGSDYNLIVTTGNNILRISCEQTFNLQVFYGRDNYL